MYKKSILILVVVLVAVFAVIYSKLLENKLNNDSIKTIYSCNKEENCCVNNADCQYIVFTGRCNTPEYVSNTLKEAQKKGMNIGEAPHRKNVTCTCEKNTCVTHN